MNSEARQVQHADDLSLDALRAGDLDEASLPHVADCAPCGDRLQSLRELAGALAMELRDAEVPPARDAAIRGAARAAGVRARRRRIARLVPVVVAIAAAVLFFVLRSSHTSEPSPQVATQAVAPLDVNGDGVVDILDAFVLARRLEGGAVTRGTWDANGDAVVDRLDVEALAQRVVRLPGTVEEQP